MKTRLIALAGLLILGVGSPALAQFASSSGSAGGGPNISGAGTGLSAPAHSSGPGLSNPNAMTGPAPNPATTTPVQPVYPGVGIGGAGLPPAAVMPEVARPATHVAQPGAAAPH